MKDFKYKTSFSSKIRCIIDEDKDRFLAKASLENLKSIIPASVQEEIDLLPIAFNSCTPNLGNRNGDMIDGKTALAIYGSFVNKPINVEHERITPIGHIVSASFSEFNTNYSVGNGSKVIEASDLKDEKGPFNLALAAVLYRLYSQNIVEEIEESSDPNSKKYLSYSASWELAFDEYDLAVGSKYLEDCKIISAEGEVDKLTKYLLDEGGNGKTPEGEPIFRLIKGDVLPLGIGITEGPAAEVMGITSSKETEVIEVRSSLGDAHVSFPRLVDFIKTELSNAQIKEKSSQNKKEVVKPNNNNNKPSDHIMKIESTKDITDKLLKMEEVQASDVTDFINSKVNEISEEFVKEKTELTDKLAETATEAKSLGDKLEETSTALKKVEEELKSLADANVAREEQEIFSNRMTYFSDEYKLDEKTRNIVANRVKGLGEEDYAILKEELEFLLANVKIVKHDEESDDCGCDNCACAKVKAAKEAKEAKASEKKEEPKKEESKKEEPKAEGGGSPDGVIDDAISNAKKTNETVPNTPNQEESTDEKWQRAFGKENWEVTRRK